MLNNLCCSYELLAVDETADLERLAADERTGSEHESAARRRAQRPLLHGIASNLRVRLIRTLRLQTQQCIKYSTKKISSQLTRESAGVSVDAAVFFLLGGTTGGGGMSGLTMFSL